MTVGEKYENRRNNKTGVIEEVNEKFKTVILRDSDGKSFNLTFSTIRSNWRKFKEEDVENSDGADEKTPEEIKAEKRAKAKAKAKAERKKEIAEMTLEERAEIGKLTSEDKVRIFEERRHFIEDLIDGYEILHARAVSGKIVRLKHSRTNFSEIYLHPDKGNFNVRLKAYLYEAVADKLSDYTVKYFATHNHQYSVRGIPFDDMEKILRLVAEAEIALTSQEDSESDDVVDNDKEEE